MTQPAMPDLPGFDAMADTLEFARKMWGGEKPSAGLAIPALSEAEINKQIADLKAVEAWLEVNANMLRNAIQALEMQSATLSTLRAMGKMPEAAASTATAPLSTSAAGSTAALAWWSLLQEQFNQTVAGAMAEEKSPKKKKVGSATSPSVAAKKTATKPPKRASVRKPAGKS